VSIDSDEVYGEIVRTFQLASHSVDSNDVYNEIMAALRYRFLRSPFRPRKSC
jgi:hypothetical protein